MAATPMQPGELDIDTALVERLVARRFPAWAGLPLRPVPSAGTDNAMFRLGDDLVGRLPRVPYARGQVEKEQRWLPLLAPHLPLDVPVPVGRAGESPDFPMPWSVYRWLDGDDTYAVPLTDLAHAAVELAASAPPCGPSTRATVRRPSGAARSRPGRTATCRAPSGTSAPRA
ncbi:phosphotransferase [Streptomyces lateritius]|uniref:phosphotransferase n=1 Tax=Streptomyces lateritius TaxID=67313 RepID=UPI0037DA6CC4